MERLLISLGKHDPVTLKISHTLAKSKSADIDIYLFIPGEIGLNSQVLSESEFFYNCIEQKRTYFSDKNLLPLVHSRLAQRGRLSNNQYRVSLSLFAYQYVMALDAEAAKIVENKKDVGPDDIDTLIELSLDILKRLRRTIPYDEILKRYYSNIDNYLSWYTEQKFLYIVSNLNRDSEYKTIRQRLVTLAEKEQAHRALNHYNSAKATSDIVRLSNKMRLLRRLIEHPIVLKEKVQSLGNNVKRMVKGLATGLVMLFVTITVISARDYLGEITASFIVAMSFIYALREIFKDDLREILWRWLRRGKPKWRRRYFDPSTNKQIGHKLEWLDYKTVLNLPERIQRIRKKRITQREELVIHYRSETEMTTSRFLSGYEETLDSVYIDFRTLTRMFDKDSNRVYILDEGQITRENVEKRHLVNLIIKEHSPLTGPSYYRWKVVLNRSKIVDIESIELTEKELGLL